MAPDLNSLPPSTSTTNSVPDTTSNSPSPLSSIRSASRTMQPINTQHPPSPHRPSGGADATPVSPIPRSGSMSLQAAATLNAGLQRNEPPRREPGLPPFPPGRYMTDLVFRNLSEPFLTKPTVTYRWSTPFPGPHGPPDCRSLSAPARRNGWRYTADPRPAPESKHIRISSHASPALGSTSHADTKSGRASPRARERTGIPGQPAATGDTETPGAGSAPAVGAGTVCHHQRRGGLGQICGPTNPLDRLGSPVSDSGCRAFRLASSLARFRHASAELFRYGASRSPAAIQNSESGRIA